MDRARRRCEDGVKSQYRIIWWTALVLVLLAGGIGVDRLLGDDGSARVALEERVTALTQREQLLTLERDRLRVERDQLEARLAAGDTLPICPTRYVSTALGTLPGPFTFDYPCSWHVLQDAVERIEGSRREGLQVSITLVSRFPIALVPSERPLGDIELADWSAQGESDDLPTLEEWIAEARTTFESEPDESRFEGGSGTTIARLTGSHVVAGASVPVVMMVWEYVDPFAGLRHIVQATSVTPSRETRAALDRVARSFQVREAEV